MLVNKSMLVVAALASTDDARPLLETVKLYKEDGKTVAVATDSYVLGEIIEETPDISEYPELSQPLTDPDAVLLPAKAAIKIAKAITKSKVLPVLNYAVIESDKAIATDLEETTTLGFKSPEGNYPDYRKLMEKYDGEYVTVKLNPKYIKTVLGMFKGDIEVNVSVPVDDKYAPTIFRTEGNGTKKTALIMPLK